MNDTNRLKDPILQGRFACHSPQIKLKANLSHYKNILVKGKLHLPIGSML